MPKPPTSRFNGRTRLQTLSRWVNDINLPGIKLDDSDGPQPENSATLKCFAGGATEARFFFQADACSVSSLLCPQVLSCSHPCPPQSSQLTDSPLQQICKQKIFHQHLCPSLAPRSLSELACLPSSYRHLKRTQSRTTPIPPVQLITSPVLMGAVALVSLFTDCSLRSSPLSLSHQSSSIVDFMGEL
ncbi:hypothetical protein L210DRAFT_470150 [Boletus edulis BED1]|uniref:Uncharacterized protein n=1 Tax=Boletus edulis BED1 TaxID=1328754 RepID=A0AAD4BK31_BOLED|nr:hypothetical protein L210DRAFT_470150 [Boletus edulis BED1]